MESGSAALKRGHPLSDVLRGMERATETVVAAIRSGSKPASGDSLLQVGRTAANRDAGLASLVVEAYRKAGPDGIVVIEKTALLTTELEVQEGMYFDRGYVDPGLVKSGAHENVLQEAYILVYDSKISSMRDLLPLLEQIATAGAPLLIIADDIEGEALATLVVNRKKGTLNCIAVKAPGYAERRKAILQDIAALTGGTPITLSEGRRLDSITLRDLGRAHKVIVTGESTTILGGAGESTIGEHVEAISTGEVAAIEQQERFKFITISVSLDSSHDYADIVRAIAAELRRQISEREQLKELAKSAWDFLKKLEVAGVRYREEKRADLKDTELVP